MRVMNLLASLSSTKWVLSAVLSLAAASTVQATVLTFDIYTDAGKTTYFNAAMANVPSYGDAVTDFSPAGSFDGGRYFNYGSTGGFTPDINVEYQYVRQPTYTEGNAGEAYTGYYGDLPRSVWSALPTNLTEAFYQEFRLVPGAGVPATLLSFDWASPTAQSGLSLKIVEDIEGTPVTLWQAGPDGSVTLSGGGHTTYTPNITAAAGKTLSLMWSPGVNTSNVNIGVSNIAFSQVQVPEPGSIAVLAALTGLMGLRRYKAQR